MGLQIGLIGGGAIAGTHLMGYERLPDVERIVVADPNETVLAEKKKQFPHVETTRDYRDILADPKIALVDVCLPHYLHHPVTLEAFRRVKTSCAKSRSPRP